MSKATVPTLTYLSADLSPTRQHADLLGQEITELYGYINAATAQLLTMIREFDQQKLWHLCGICSCAHWLNWKCMRHRHRCCQRESPRGQRPG